MIDRELLEILAPAFVTGLVIALAHVPLGIEVLRRGIIFIDLAIAQIAGLGLVFSEVLLHAESLWLKQLTALAFAVIAALIFRGFEKRMPAQLEAIIGSSFVLAASVAILLVAQAPDSGEQIQHLLSGQLLFASWQNILSMLPVYIGALLIWILTPRLRQGLGFYILFALVITTSVQLVGVYMVFASLILPAIAVVHVHRKYLIAVLCGGSSVLLGLFAALLTDLPAGPLIVVAYCACAAVLFFITGAKETSIKQD